MPKTSCSSSIYHVSSLECKAKFNLTCHTLDHLQRDVTLHIVIFSCQPCAETLGTIFAGTSCVEALVMPRTEKKLILVRW